MGVWTRTSGWGMYEREKLVDNSKNQNGNDEQMEGKEKANRARWRKGQKTETDSRVENECKHSQTAHLYASTQKKRQDRLKLKQDSLKVP